MSTVRERSKALGYKTKGVALNSYADAKDAVQATYSNTQDTLQSGLDKTQHTIIESWEKVQDWLHNLNRPGEGMELPTKSRKGILPLISHNTVPLMPTLEQKGLQKGLNKVQETLKLNKAQDALNKQASQTREGLIKAQQKLGDRLNEVQNTLQDSVQATKAKTMTKLNTTIDKSTKPFDKVSKNLTQVSESIKERKENAQERHEQRVRRQQRARKMFRWGVIIGVVLALLYTPRPGAEVRTKLAQTWRNYRAQLGL